MGNLFFLAFVIIIFAFFASAVRILQEYERGVIYVFGRYWKIKGPGIIMVWPIVQAMIRLDIRTIVLEVPSQDVISRDNVSVTVSAVVYYKVVTPEKAINNVGDFNEATSQLAQTTLRSVLGQHELDTMLSERERLNLDLRKTLDEQTENWGIKVSNVEIKAVDLNESMIRAIAKQAEAERERRAKIIHAEGEMQASEKLLAAAQILAQQPQAIQLRYLQTLSAIGEANSSVIVFPFPLEFLHGLTKMVLDQKQ
jgi:regulator of protease activity HflC (stomatin/prohibitin superfamily)